MKQFSQRIPVFVNVGFAKTMVFPLLFIFLFIGCKKDMEPHNQDIKKIEEGMVVTPPPVHPLQKEFRVVTGNAEQERGKPIYFDPYKLDPQYRQMVMRALKMSEEVCDDYTKLYQWLDYQLSDWSEEMIINAINTAMLDLPSYHAIFFENRTFGQYYGKRGEYTLRLLWSFQKLKHFWDIDSRSIVLVGMHGNMLNNRHKVYNVYSQVFELTPDDALFYTNVVSKLLKLYPGYRYGEHPIFTFNAYSQPSIYFPPVGVLPPKIMMGDGILDGYAAIGYKDVAPQAILAHEYGHQVQFQLGIFENDETPETTRRMELMADAYSAYYLTHIRGEFMRWGRMRQFLQVFFNIGDCATTSSGHHGTPKQRMAAAEWAYEIAKNAQRQGRVLSGKTFQQMFDKALPEILAH